MIPGSRSARIQALVAEQAALRGAQVGLLDVCTAAVTALPVGGAGVSAMSRGRASHPLCSTDSVSRQLEELQLTLGEGPCVDAFVLGSSVLCTDLLAGELQRHWAVFADAALEAGARAVFAFPLRIGAISPGVLDLYSSTSVELDADEVADAMAFADTATLLLLDAGISETGVPSGTDVAGTDRPDDAPFDDLGGYRAEIDQATGILMVQLGVGVEEAFIRLRAHAYARGIRISVVAADVVAHRLRFRRETTPSDVRPPDARPADTQPPDARPPDEEP
ncbi:GAF and ANTAR domain-containing protein [Streptomyces sp. Ag109_O5-10]|uniref:GAF and ANTAR domain-containing protein n=1 Tax=Streptomyces sp. Ag109_O5-10 TaxID=1855349 RepID=UPI00089AB35D|nr:GAF and ANTAR domain-containing protein [Streptomyces sp. Ag109_O5-10]SEE21784.1 ANTAR domain-containing protein [Streptomyces sp. Ag109_O5-10]